MARRKILISTQFYSISNFIRRADWKTLIVIVIVVKISICFKLFFKNAFSIQRNKSDCVTISLKIVKEIAFGLE